MTFPSSDCELLGIFEFESAECGDDGDPFIRLERQGLISNAELTLIDPWSGYKCKRHFNVRNIFQKTYLVTTLIGHRYFHVRG